MSRHYFSFPPLVSHVCNFRYDICNCISLAIQRADPFAPRLTMYMNDTKCLSLEQSQDSVHVEVRPGTKHMLQTLQALRVVVVGGFTGTASGAASCASPALPATLTIFSSTLDVT